MKRFLMVYRYWEYLSSGENRAANYEQKILGFFSNMNEVYYFNYLDEQKKLVYHWGLLAVETRSRVRRNETNNSVI